MDETRFEDLVRTFGAEASRRRAIVSAAALVVAGALGRASGEDAAARGKRSRRSVRAAAGNPTKTTICH
ncbi:MAG: hypothetical protein ACKOWF_01705 [Chloroflexota bacterium]